MEIPNKLPATKRHAEALGVSQGHLYRMLRGYRPFLPEHLKKFEAMLEGEKKEGIADEDLPFEQCLIIDGAGSADTAKEAIREFGEHAVLRGDKLIFNADHVFLSWRNKGQVYCQHTKHFGNPEGPAHVRVR